VVQTAEVKEVLAPPPSQRLVVLGPSIGGNVPQSDNWNGAMSLLASMKPSSHSPAVLMVMPGRYEGGTLGPNVDVVGYGGKVERIDCLVRAGAISNVCISGLTIEQLSHSVLLDHTNVYTPNTSQYRVENCTITDLNVGEGVRLTLSRSSVKSLTSNGRVDVIGSAIERLFVDLGRTQVRESSILTSMFQQGGSSYYTRSTIGGSWGVSRGDLCIEDCTTMMKPKWTLANHDEMNTVIVRRTPLLSTSGLAFTIKNEQLSGRIDRDTEGDFEVGAGSTFLLSQYLQRTIVLEPDICTPLGLGPSSTTARIGGSASVTGGGKKVVVDKSAQDTIINIAIRARVDVGGWED
jgi:hypothetical protein